MFHIPGIPGIFLKSFSHTWMRGCRANAQQRDFSPKIIDYYVVRADERYKMDKLLK